MPCRFKRFASTRSTFQPGRASPGNFAAPAQLCQRPSAFTYVPEVSANVPMGSTTCTTLRKDSGKCEVTAITKSADASAQGSTAKSLAGSMAPKST